jgi:hypothetical protein
MIMPQCETIENHLRPGYKYAPAAIEENEITAGKQNKKVAFLFKKGTMKEMMRRK